MPTGRKFRALLLRDEDLPNRTRTVGSCLQVPAPVLSATGPLRTTGHPRPFRRLPRPRRRSHPEIARLELELDRVVAVRRRLATPAEAEAIVHAGGDHRAVTLPRYARPSGAEGFSSGTRLFPLRRSSKLPFRYSHRSVRREAA